MALWKAYGAKIWGDFVVNGEVTKVTEELAVCDFAISSG